MDPGTNGIAADAPSFEQAFGPSSEQAFEPPHGCAVLFDLFHSCSSVKGRFKDYYRYGQVRNCMPYWNDFFLCLRLKLEPSHEAAKNRWQLRRAQSVRERFNQHGLATETPTDGVVWRLRETDL